MKAKRNTAITIAIVALATVLAVAIYVAFFEKTPTEKIMDNLKNIEIGIDEEAYNEIMEAMKKVTGK